MAEVKKYIKEHKGKLISLSIFLIVSLLVFFIWGEHALGVLWVLPLAGFLFLGLWRISDIIGGDMIGLIILVCGAGIFLIVDSKDYEKVSKNKTLVTCENYLAHAVHLHKKEVAEWQTHLERTANIWQLDEFINIKPLSPKCKEYKEILDAKCENLYSEACKTNTVDGWIKYMEQVPTSYYKDAEEKVIELRERVWKRESTAWQEACKLHNSDGYEKYLSLYPRGAHAKAAIDAQVNLIIGGEHGEMPKMEKTGYFYSSTSTITVSNDTQYEMTLLYSGPESRRVVLSPYASKSLTLRNGTYRIAASVKASNVRSYAGSDELTGGNYSSSFYILGGTNYSRYR